jgi:exopolysaccharide biosynthesis operon protein EpsL
MQRILLKISQYGLDCARTRHGTDFASCVAGSPSTRRTTMRGKKIATIIALACNPALVFAFQAIEEIQWPDSGRFPAYPQEPSDGRNVRFSVFGGAMHDSNLFRLSDGTDPLTAIGSTKRSDTITRFGAGLKGDIPVSRQRILLEARIEHRDFDHFGFLDHDAYRLGATWKWAAGPQWSGDIGAGKRRYLASLAELQAPIKDLITENRAYASAGYRFTPRWRVRGGLEAYDWEHDDPSRVTLDNRTDAATIGLDYVTPADNSVGGQFKYSEGDFPNRQVVPGGTVDNNFQEYETSAVAHWTVTGTSALDGRLGYTIRRHDQVGQRDFDGVTGKLAYDWFVAARTLLNLSVWREIRSIEDTSASYVLSEGWGIGPSWAPVSKIVFQAKYVREDRDYRGDPGFALAGTPQREDTFRGFNLAAGYSPRRNIELGVAIETGDRSSNTAGRDYDYNAVSANARLRF